MKFLPEVGAGTRILKVKLPGYEKILGSEGEARAREGRSPGLARAEGPRNRLA